MIGNSLKNIRHLFSRPDRARRLFRHVWQHFKEDRCFDQAASLSYTSLLSIVPLLAVVFGVASAFPVFDQWSDQLQHFVFRNIVPTSGEQVQQYLTGFLDSVSQLTLPGISVLILTALLLMMRIEKAFNLIWRVSISRGLINRIIMYWAVLTLGPLALGVAAALSAQPLLETLGVSASQVSGLQGIGVFVLTWLAFGLMFLLVPYCSVPVPYALTGALLSTVLFSLAKAGFLAFIGKASYNVLYGALATIPIFLFWLYLVWIVILLGASLAASLTTFDDRRGEWNWPWEWEFLLVYRLLGHLWKSQQSGETLTLEDLLQREPGAGSSSLQRILGLLIKEKLVTLDNEDHWLLRMNLAHYRLEDLYRAGAFHLPAGQTLPVKSHGEWDAAFMQVIEKTTPDMRTSLEDLYQQSGKESARKGAG